MITVNGKSPRVAPGCWLAPNCTLVGDVTLGEGCTIWFGAVLRGDVAPITLGQRVNVQDNAVMHGTLGKYPVLLGDDVTVGHAAIVHGCTIESRVLIGMGAVVLDGAHVESDNVIGAAAVVTQGKHLEQGGVYVGSPAKRLKDISDEARIDLLTHAQHYVDYAKWYE